MGELNTNDLDCSLKALQPDESLFVIVETKRGERLKLDRKVLISWSDGKVILYEKA